MYVCLYFTGHLQSLILQCESYLVDNNLTYGLSLLHYCILLPLSPPTLVEAILDRETTPLLTFTVVASDSVPPPNTQSSEVRTQPVLS